MSSFDYSALRGLIRRKGYTQESLANATHISLSMLSGKINGRYRFTQKDIQLLCDVLDISCDDIGRYFFASEVAVSQPAAIESCITEV